MNNFFKSLGLTTALFICAFLLGCTTMNTDNLTIKALISDMPIKLIYDKEDPVAPSLLIPVEITIDNTSSGHKVFSSVFFSKGLIADYTVYEMKDGKLLKKKQTRKDTIIIEANTSKKYIAYSNIEIYTPHYPEFEWKDKEQKLLESGSDTLLLENYKAFSTEYEKLGKAVNIDSLKLWFYDTESENYKESLKELNVVVDK